MPFLPNVSMLQPTPRPSKGKRTHDKLRFLPSLPDARQRPAWQVNPPTFLLTGKPDETLGDDRGYNLVKELTASKNTFISVC